MTTSIASVLKKVKLRLLELHFKANCGHIGGNFSCVDALVTLHHRVMRPGDSFILSKGHAAGALYVTLWSMHELSDEALATFCEDGTSLPGHPSGAGIPGLLFPTGSLGHGPSLAAGVALGARHKGSASRTYCLCSDGEWQEGSCWEALAFSVAHGLGNLTILIDQNGWQGFGPTAEVMPGTTLMSRISSFGARCRQVDGHDCARIQEALEPGVPTEVQVVILQTRKAHGLHFEGTLESHYLPLTEEQFRAAYADIERGR